ncbi:MAG: carboxypeptidase-like regulatory domain-containing protein [Planctomycetota bacterium]
MKRFICAFAALVVALASQPASAADVIQNQWVRANQDGAVSGRVVVPRTAGISALREGKVSLVDERGIYVTRDLKSDNTGRFTLEGVTPGVYTLIISGKDAFACCAMHVVSSEVALQDEFVIAAGAINPGVVRATAVRYLPSGQMAKKSPIVFDPSVNPMSSDRLISRDSLHVRRSEGGLKGQINQAGLADELAAPKSNVLVFRDGVEVARTLTNEAGEFFVPNLPLGSYAIMGTGQHGLVVVGLELVDDSMTAKAEKADASRLVQQPGEIADGINVQVAPLPGAGQVIEDRVIDEQIIDLGIVDDGGFIQGGVVGGGGPIGGGPAGGGGRGRLRGILPLGLGGAALAVALADDDDGVVSAVASPATP